MTNENSLIWHEINWMRNPACEFFFPREDLPRDKLLICKFKSSAGVSFQEMIYADSEEGFYVLQQAISKFWDIHNERWEVDLEWDDDYFPIAYALYPDLTGSP